MLYMAIGVLLFMAFLAYACCAVGGQADDAMEEMMKCRHLKT